MIIDCHGHVSAPAELFAYKASIMSHRGAHGRGAVNVSDDEIRAAANKVEMAPVGHLDMLKRNGTDMQLISPQPFQMMHNAKPTRVVHWFTEETNNIIYRQTQIFKGLFFGEPVHHPRRLGVVHHLERPRRDQLHIGAVALEHVQMPDRGHLDFVGGGADLVVGDADRAAAMGAAMRQDAGLVGKQFGRRAYMAMAVDDHGASRRAASREAHAPSGGSERM